RGRLLAGLSDRPRRWWKISTTVGTRLMIGAEPGGHLPAFGVFGHELLQLPVQGGGFELDERLAVQVLVLLGQQMPQPVGDAAAHPDADGAPAELPDRGQ